MRLHGREGSPGARVGGHRGHELFKVDDAVAVGVRGGDELGDVAEIRALDGGHRVERALEFLGGDGTVVVGVEVIKRALDRGFRFTLRPRESGDDELLPVKLAGAVEIDYFEDLFELRRGVGGLEL